MQMLIIGHSKIGKSTFAKNLATALNIEYIDQKLMIDRIFQKIKQNEEEPKLDEEGLPMKFLTELEEKILSDLKNGLAIDDNDTL